MSSSTAQRQAAYRARRQDAGPDGNGERRLNTWISTEAHLALARIARRDGLTQRELLERFILAEDQRILSTLRLDTPEWAHYFGK